MKVSKANLGNLTYLAEGGFGRVFRADGFRLPADPTPLAYKEFTADQAGQADSAGAAVAFRAGLRPADRDELDRYSAWPRAVVEDGSGAVCGLLMPLIPREFFCRKVDPDSGQMVSKPREIAWLISTADQRRAAQIDLVEVDYTDRLVLLAQLVYAFGLLHKHGWVFGDLSFKNAVFALDPPRLKLLDCDGAAALADPARKQSSTPFWDPPECPIEPPPGQRRQQELQDTVTDAYKLGLALLRCLTPGKGAASGTSVIRFHGELDTTGINLVARALSADRGSRPTAKDLYDYLYRVVRLRVATPEIAFAKLVTPFRLRGQAVRIDWQIKNAAIVTISAGNGSEFHVDLASHPKGYAFRLDESGPVSIEVRNHFGTVTMDLGEVTLYELPPLVLGLDHLPRPQIPALEAFSFEPITVEPITAALAQRPGIRVGVPDVPAVPSLSAPDLVTVLRSAGSVAVALPSFGNVVIGMADAIKNVVLSEGNKYVATLRRAGLGGER